MKQYRRKFTVELLEIFYGWYMVAMEGKYYTRTDLDVELRSKDLAWKKCCEESTDRAYARRQYVIMLETIINIEIWYEIVGEYHSKTREEREEEKVYNRREKYQLNDSFVSYSGSTTSLGANMIGEDTYEIYMEDNRYYIIVLGIRYELFEEEEFWYYIDSEGEKHYIQWQYKRKWVDNDDA